MPDTRDTTEALLAEVERDLDAVAASLLNDEPAQLEAACQSLRGVAVRFAGVLEAALSAEVFDPAFRRRIEAVAARLAVQRDSVARRNVVVERALASLMRRHTDPTYAPPGLRPGFGAMASPH